MGDLARPPDYRALLEARGAPRPTDEPGLIDEDPPRVDRLRPTTVRAARSHLAQVIRDHVDPRDLVDVCVAIARDTTQDAGHRLAAVRTLFDRGWGRPAQLHQVESTVTAAAAGQEGVDALLRLSDRELVEAVEMADQIRARLAAAAAR